MVKYVSYVIAACCLILVSFTNCPAVQVDVFMPFDENNTNDMAMPQKTRNKGFCKAVYNAALADLPGTLPEDRAAVLDEFLCNEAADYVLSYKEIEVSPGEDGLSMIMDVDLNQEALKKRLKQIGVYYTSTTLLPYQMNLSGGEPEDWMMLGDLQKLTGVSSSVGSDLVLSASQSKTGYWSGTLALGQDEWTARTKEFKNLWLSLWAKYFAKLNAKSKDESLGMVTVWGWYTPDGVMDFNNKLKLMGNLIESPMLTTVVMTPVGVKAGWSGQILNKPALEEKLKAFTLERKRMGYSISSGKTE